MAEEVVNTASETAQVVAQQVELELQEIKELINALQQDTAGSWTAYFLWFFVFGVVAGGLIAAQKTLLDLLVKFSKKTDNKIDDILFAIVTIWLQPEFVIPFGAFVASTIFPIGNLVDAVARSALIGVIAYKAVRSLDSAVAFGIGEYIGPDKENENISRNIRKGASIFFYSAAAILVLDNLGFEISTLVAGFGIGGLAVALAAQSILADTIASITLFVDRPFEIGQPITVAGFTGVVERIGFKTTKLASPSGEHIIIPNSTISSSPVQNWYNTWAGQLTEFGISTKTTNEKVRALPAILKSELKSDKFNVAEVYLKSFGEYSIRFEVRYTVPGVAPPVLRDALGEINTQIREVLSNHEYKMPLPVRVIEQAAQ